MGTMEDKPDIDEKQRKRSLRYSILDGAFYSAMVGFGESFFSAFAVFLKANNFLIGLLGSLPQALGSVSLLYTNTFLRYFRTRKRLVLAVSVLQAIMFIPIMLVYFLGSLSSWALLVFVCLYWIFAIILSPAWTSWMGDLVPEDERGAYFGSRNKVAGTVSFIALLLGGLVLQQFDRSSATQYIGFAIIFTVSLVARLISFYFLWRQDEPAYQPLAQAPFTFLDFVIQARYRNHGLFIIYLCLMNFSVYISAPFFTPYLLNDLQLSYLTFTLVTAAALIVKFLVMPVWGRAADKFGSKKVLTLTGFLMPMVPILWLFSGNIWYIVLVQVCAGFVWAGFELASFNFIFDTTSPRNRATCVAYFNVLNGIALFLGAMLGGIIVRYNSIFWSKYLFVFLLSGLMRYLASFLLMSRIREVRKVESISYQKLFLSVVTTLPTLGIIHNVITFRRPSQKRKDEPAAGETGGEKK